MNSVLLIEKNGTVKEQKIKSFDKNGFYKKCGFKKPDKFEERAVWKNMKVGSDLVNFTLYAKKNGRFGFENKYDLPPPVDSALFMGSKDLALSMNCPTLMHLMKPVLRSVMCFLTIACFCSTRMHATWMWPKSHCSTMCWLR